MSETDLNTIVKLFAFEKEILAMLRTYYITATHTEKGQNALQEVKKLIHTSLSHSPARTDTYMDLASVLFDKRAEHNFTQDQEREIVAYHKEASKRLPCDPKRKDMVNHALFGKNEHSEAPTTIIEYAQRLLAVAKTVGDWYTKSIDMAVTLDLSPYEPYKSPQASGGGGKQTNQGSNPKPNPPQPNPTNRNSNPPAGKQKKNTRLLPWLVCFPPPPEACGLL